MKPLLLITLSCIVLSTSLSSQAATITAFSEVITTSVTDTQSPPAQTSGSITIEATNGAANPIRAEADIDVSGSLFVNTEGTYANGTGDSAWDSVSTVSWSETFTNTTASAQTWSFDYLVLAGSMQMSMYSGASATGTFEINIAQDSTTLTSSSVTLTPGSYVETGTGFGGTFSTPASWLTTYSWDEYTGNLLFTVDAFSTSTLSYTMTASESVNITSTSFCADTPTELNVCSTAFNGGDPFDTTSVITNITAVPVPAAAWFLGSALVGLVGFKRKK